jgi:hypothetical protein
MFPVFLVTNVPCEHRTPRVGFSGIKKTMSRASLIRDAGHTQTPHNRHAILTELELVLASPHFCHSKRYPALLQYIVENTLAGRSELLKERTIGVEVFDRPPAYDTNADTVVRYTAGEVRKRLSLYYHESGSRSPIHISLPAGSYVPEFLHLHEAPAPDGTRYLQEPDSLSLDGALHAQEAAAASPTGQRNRIRGRWWLPASAAIAVIVLAGLGWRVHAVTQRTPLEAFWAPVLHDQKTVLLCSGGVVFKPTNFSGVATAGKDIDYPFVSSQIASSIARVSTLVARNGTTMNLQYSANTPLNLLRDQPLILLGAYNNLWTLRLLDGLPVHFAPEADASIVDTTKHQRWARDPSLPYSSADDYALVARFRDSTTDSSVLVLAGLGRNGTEAATLFVTTPRYMQMLRDQVGDDLANRNIEVVLRSSVIDGKTGAPSILAVRTW